jgi:CxxC motif-containing protein
MKREIICIICPVGCPVIVEKDPDSGEILRIEGAQCKRGKEYAAIETTSPTRVIASTVKVLGGALILCPVKTSAPIPKNRIFDLMKHIATLEVEAPIAMGDVITPKVLGTEADLVATRSVPVNRSISVACAGRGGPDPKRETGDGEDRSMEPGKGPAGDEP